MKRIKNILEGVCVYPVDIIEGILLIYTLHIVSRVIWQKFVDFKFNFVSVATPGSERGVTLNFDEILFPLCKF